MPREFHTPERPLPSLFICLIAGTFQGTFDRAREKFTLELPPCGSLRLGCDQSGLVGPGRASRDKKAAHQNVQQQPLQIVIHYHYAISEPLPTEASISSTTCQIRNDAGRDHIIDVRSQPSGIAERRVGVQEPRECRRHRTNAAV